MMRNDKKNRIAKIEMQYSWQEHSSFEKEHQKSNVANNEALEVHIALPNELAEDKRRLEQVCDDLAHEIVGKIRTMNMQFIGITIARIFMSIFFLVSVKTK